MEFEMVERLRGEDDDEDSALIDNHSALENQSSVRPEDYPDRTDKALEFPEEERS